MKFPLDLKAIGYGLAIFVAGYMLMSLIGSGMVAAGDSATRTTGWSFLWLLGNALPVVAGYVSACRAPDRRITHGIIGGASGVIILLAPILFVPNLPKTGIPSVVCIYILLAALGAIIGSYRGGRRGR